MGEIWMFDDAGITVDFRRQFLRAIRIVTLRFFAAETGARAFLYRAALATGIGLANAPIQIDTTSWRQLNFENVVISEKRS
jgi:hypothetical protein